MAPVDESSYTGEEFIQLLEQDGMKKMSKKNPTPSDTLFSLDEMNEATLEQFQSGTLNGMAECHGVVDEEIRRLRRSLEDVWSIYNTGVITPDNKAIVDKIVFAVDTLTTLADMFQDAYFGKLDEFKKESEDSGSRELWG